MRLSARHRLLGISLVVAGLAAACGGDSDDNVSAEARSAGVASTAAGSNGTSPDTTIDDTTGGGISNNVNIVNQGEFNYGNYNVTIENLTVNGDAGTSQSDGPTVVQFEVSTVDENGEPLSPEELAEALFLEAADGVRSAPTNVVNSDEEGTATVEFEVTNDTPVNDWAIGIRTDDSAAEYFELDTGAEGDIAIDTVVSGSYTPQSFFPDCDDGVAEISIEDLYLTTTVPEEIREKQPRADDGWRYLIGTLRLNYTETCARGYSAQPRDNAFVMVIDRVNSAPIYGLGIGQLDPGTGGRTELVWKVPAGVGTIEARIGVYDKKVIQTIEIPDFR
jgi:hypothetical protein